MVGRETAALNMTRKLCYRKDDRTMRPIYRCPENFQESLTTSTPPCLQNFYRPFAQIEPANVPAKFEVDSFSLSVPEIIGSTA